MNICYRCGDEYEDYIKKLNNYGVTANGLAFGVGYKKRVGPNKTEVNYYRRKDKYIRLCEKCLNETINFIEVFNDNKKEVQKHDKRIRKNQQ